MTTPSLLVRKIAARAAVLWLALAPVQALSAPDLQSFVLPLGGDAIFGPLSGTRALDEGMLRKLHSH